MPTSLNIEDITILGAENALNMMPEEIFFRDREEGILRPNTIPLPMGAKEWKRARYMGEEVHVARDKNTLWVLADTTIFGYCLFKLVSQSDNDTTFKVAYSGGTRIISNERSNIIMAGSMTGGLGEIAARYQAGSVNPMQLGNSGATAIGSTGSMAPVMPGAGEGVTRNIDARRLHSEIVSRGYVAGYVMGNAPQVSMSLTRKKANDGTVTANIVAKESKPSRCLAVLMALPANCIQRNGTFASPTDIKAGLVDYTDSRSEMQYYSFTMSAAITYIGAFGGYLPEYAPNVSNARTQWSPEDILSSRPDVTFVYVKATENKRRSSANPDQFRFNLKTTSNRKSLYTLGNHVCLRALEHTSVKCSSDADAYRLNEIAFGAWRYRKKKSEPENSLQRAMRDCPSQIWSTKYNIDGKEVEGIGSCFFASGAQVTSGSGETTPVKPLSYFRWYQTGDQKPEMPSRVEKIVTRVFSPASGDKKENMVTKPVYMKDDPNNSLFSGYRKFVEYVVESGYMSRDKLLSMGSRAARRKQRTLSLTPDQMSSLEYFMQREDVAAEIQSVRDEASDLDVIRASKS